MDRTLFLNERPGLRVSRDGPSLWIEQAGRAGQRVPVRLVRRVIVAGNVALDAGSLALLAERGIPVALFDRHGTPQAVVLGLRDGLRQRRARQVALSEDREKHERIVAWLDAWERGRQWRLLRRLDPARAHLWRRTGFRSCDYEQWIAVEARARGRSPQLRMFLRGMLQALVASEILSAGWDPHAGVRQRSTLLGFVKDCTSALHPDADQLWLTAPAAPDQSQSVLTRAVAAHFDAARGRMETLVRVMLDQFARLLWERS